jgi:predicted RNA-binding protein (TIGR00451 family)
MEAGVRHALREDEISIFKSKFESKWGISLDDGLFEVAEIPPTKELDFVLIDRLPVAMYYNQNVLPTILGAQQYDPNKKVVTIDNGAVEALTERGENNLMRPGVEEVNEDISEGDVILIKSDESETYVALGHAVVDGKDMVGENGKAANIFFHVLGPEEIEEINRRLAQQIGISVDGEIYELVRTHPSKYNFVIVDGDPDIFHFEQEAYPTLPALNKYNPDQGVAVLDASKINTQTKEGYVLESVINQFPEKTRPGDVIILQEDSSGDYVGIGRKLSSDENPTLEGQAVVETIYYRDSSIDRTIANLS